MYANGKKGGGKKGDKYYRNGKKGAKSLKYTKKCAKIAKMVRKGLFGKKGRLKSKTGVKRRVIAPTPESAFWSWRYNPLLLLQFCFFNLFIDFAPFLPFRSYLPPFLPPSPFLPQSISCHFIHISPPFYH